ncbi:hypothetical protein BASA83_009814 [Batrachochytrium salamandrivorans]|nr:hypothetical protein BASA83_009814 [Batrachochytrium salamandrivorans]
MMAAQAAVLSATSATSTTGVNLVKRAPTSDDEVEQSDTGHLTESIEDLKERRKGKPSAERTRINAALAEFEKELRELEEELSELKAYYELQADKYRDINQAVYDNNFGYLREKYLNSQ